MKKALLLLFFVLFSVGTYAQSDSLVVKNDKSSIVQKKFNSKKIDSYKKDADFNYEELNVQQKSSWFERLFYWMKRGLSRFIEWIFGVKYATGIIATLFKVIPYVIAGIILFLLLKFFLKVNSNSIISNAANKAIVSITEDEELIKNKDISKLIQQAIAQKNYRLAVRYYYLKSLQLLENKEFITWEQQKTNEDYIKEISIETVKSSFQELTRLYDFVWYGNFEINAVEFARVELNFEQTNNLINGK